MSYMSVLCMDSECLFFVNDTATSEIYTYFHTLSLHDALPISSATAPRIRRCPIRPASSRWPTPAPSAASAPARPRAPPPRLPAAGARGWRSEEHTSELQSLMRKSYAVFCLKKKHKTQNFQQHLHFLEPHAMLDIKSYTI